ncbi:ORF6N domain-containing protein [Clostridium sp. UBA1652]|uniref:ORF6N domain-containing protein n=1 Tax=Clostridium sp. UBA1652 TaxID=1946348 RepID=UPI00257C0566|nr:ORF6N domain-containing protein [Clostridium sp. UBA1652]
MNKLKPLEFKKQRIITTKVLAEEFGTEEKNVQMNFANNHTRFIEDKHYFKLEGQALKDFKNSLPNDIGSPLKYASSLILWTEKGAARHAKILDTDEAWEVYEQLEETYFRVKESEPKTIEDLIIMQAQSIKNLKQQVTEANYNATKAIDSAEETKQEVQAIREAVTLEPNQWRKDTANLINKIATKLGGFEHIKPIRDEAYNLLNNTYGVDIKRRLLNKRKNMALEGCSKSKIEKVNYLDVIAEDKKLINGYINIVGRLAVKHGVA